MKNFRMACVAAVVALGFSVAASAADRPVSKAGLNKMGLGSMRAVDGNAVRGKGSFAFAAGNASSQLFNGPVSTGVYAAGASHYYGSSFATGSAVSVTTAGYFVSTSYTSSSAYAK